MNGSPAQQVFAAVLLPLAVAVAVAASVASGSPAESVSPAVPRAAQTLAQTQSQTQSQGNGRSAVAEESLDMALRDRRYLMRQLRCALGEAPCDPVGRRLKSLAPLVLRGACPQCTPEEMRQIQKVLSHVQRNFPKEWNKVVQQYVG